MNVEEWRNQGESSRYPFVESCELRASSGMVLPSNFLVDAQIFVNSGEALNVRVSKISLVGDTVVGFVSSDLGLIGRFIIPPGSLSNGVVDLIDLFGISRGKLITGNDGNAIYGHLASGENLFEANQALFESSCVFELPKCVNALVVNESRLPGKLALVEGPGVTLERLSPSLLIVNAVGSNDPLEECCDQSADGGLLTINQLSADSFGSFRFDLGEFSEPSSNEELRQILRIDPISNGVVFYLTR